MKRWSECIEVNNSLFKSGVTVFRRGWIALQDMAWPVSHS